MNPIGQTQHIYCFVDNRTVTLIEKMLHLLIPRWKIIQIFVKPLNGQTIVLETDMNDTIRKLKHKIYEKESIPIETQ